MAKRALPFLFIPSLLMLCVVLLSSCEEQSVAGTELVVYAYDSFASEWGIGPQVIPLFEAQTGAKVKLVTRGDGGQVLTSLIREKADPQADVVIGLDGNLLPRARAEGVLSAYVPEAIKEVPEDLRMDAEGLLTPFDYGYFTLVWDTEKLAVPPTSMADLVKPEYANKLILLDPRTSTPGLGFLAASLGAMPDGWQAWWKALQPSILTMAPGWDTGYGLFTQGEAPLVWSYSTSPAYHLEYDKTERYKALDLAEGLVRQIEGVGIVKGSKKEKLARLFVDFCLSPAFQDKVALYQWMFPVRSSTELPESYRIALKPAKVLTVDPARLDAILPEWTAQMVD